MERFLLIISLLFLLTGSTVFGQLTDTGSAISARWRMNFELLDTPATITITDPEGRKEVYWYFRYKIVNDTDQKLEWRGDIKIIIDKTQPGVPEHKVPGLFQNAQIPLEEDGVYYRMVLETGENDQNDVWEVVFFQDNENRLSLVKKSKISKDQVDTIDIARPYTGKSRKVDSRENEMVEFLEREIEAEGEMSFEARELKKMAQEEIVPLINSEYDMGNFVALYKVAVQIGMKTFNRPEIYVRRLRSYYDVDLPIVTDKIMQELQLYPRLTAAERMVLYSLEPKNKEDKQDRSIIEVLGKYYVFVLEFPKEEGNDYWETVWYEDLYGNSSLVHKKRIRDIQNYRGMVGVKKLSTEDEELFEKANQAAGSVKREKSEYKDSRVYRAGVLDLSYEEAQNAMVNLVVRKLVLPKDIKINPIFVQGTDKGAKFLLSDENGKNSEIIVTEENAVEIEIAGWQMVSFAADHVVMKKTTPQREIIASFYAGATIEYRYGKSYKIYVEEDIAYFAGMSARALYKGRNEDGTFRMENLVIPPKKQRLFSISMDFLNDFRQGTFSPELHTKFKNEKEALSDNLSIEVEEWRIVNKQGIGYFTIMRNGNQLQIYQGQKHVFDVEAADHQVALSKGIISDALKKVFEEKEINIEEDFRIKEAREWRIYDRDNKKIYLAINESSALTIYRFNNNYSHHGLAIFPDISPEMDYMGIVVSGMVDPIIKRQYYVPTKWEVVNDTGNTVAIIKRIKDQLIVYKGQRSIFNMEIGYQGDLIKGNFPEALKEGLKEKDIYVNEDYKINETNLEKKSYIENEAYIIAYKRPGDEFNSYRSRIEHLYNKWVVLSRKIIK